MNRWGFVFLFLGLMIVGFVSGRKERLFVLLFWKMGLVILMGK